MSIDFYKINHTPNMQHFYLKNTLLSLIVLLFCQCATIKVTETSTDVTHPKFKKILFIEETNDGRTYDFYNKFRKALRRQCSKRGIEAEFIRITPNLTTPEEKLTALKMKFQPELLFSLKTSNAKWHKWGALNDSIKQISVNCTLTETSNTKSIWEGSIYIEQFYGVDVASEKAAKKLIESLKL
jgi:hypothetical protein